MAGEPDLAGAVERVVAFSSGRANAVMMDDLRLLTDRLATLEQERDDYFQIVMQQDVLERDTIERCARVAEECMYHGDTSVATITAANRALRECAEKIRALLPSPEETR